MSLFSRTDQSFLAEWWWTVDRSILSAVLILAVFGVALVATASPAVAEHLGLGSYHFLKRHVVILLPALSLMLFLSLLDRTTIWRLASLLFLASIAGMIGVLFTGSEIKGAQRWVNIAGFSLQPSEFVKPAFIIIAAWFMAKHKEKKEFPGYFITAGLYALLVTLLLLQPDFGMTLIITAVLSIQIFLVGLPFRLLAGFGAFSATGLVFIYFTFDHVKSRVDRFLNPESGDNFQVEKSLEAFQNAGLLGKGPGHGSVKFSLPDAHADFIFSVAGEELGLIFIALLMGLFLFVILRGLTRLRKCEDVFVILSAGGLLSMFGLQSLVHMGSALNLLPAKGMTLPFISYGGSSLLSMGFSLGCVLALTRFQKRTGISKAGLSLQSAQLAGKRSVFR